MHLFIEDILKKDPQTVVAVKILTLKVAQSVYDFVDLELNILSKIEGSNVVRFLLIRSGQSLSESTVISCIRQIVSGYMSIYQRYIIHGRLKPSNILIHEGQLKIADFGLGRILERLNTLYLSPQQLSGQGISGKCDIWSLGIIFYELLYGHTPWQGLIQRHLTKALIEFFKASEPIQNHDILNH